MEKLVRDEVAWSGQHWLEVMRIGKPVDPANWMARVPVEAEGLAHAFQRHEQEMDVWRLYVRWPAREWVRVGGCSPLAGQQAVLWWLEPGQTIRGGIASAAALFWLRTECWPIAGYIWKEPPDDWMVLEDATRQEGTENKLALRCGAWVPKGYVLVAGRIV